MEEEYQKKKLQYKVSTGLESYLKRNGRWAQLPLSYDDLLRFDFSSPIYDKDDVDTLWQSVMYAQTDMKEIHHSLKQIYAMLYADGDMSIIHHLIIERVEYCTFGNSKPFRIRLKNALNDNYGYYYIKTADASRLYGLELEHILSPNKINFVYNNNTLIEDHIAGIPGDDFIKNYFTDSNVNIIRIAKEFIKFNERCFVRLLGDMRSYNYVVDITPDFEEAQYRIRAIDFDQQSYEGRKNLYFPQFFKENYPAVKLCIKHINRDTAYQYQKEERTLMARRLKTSRYRLKDLIDTMCHDKLAPTAHVQQLSSELAVYFKDNTYLKCRSMGDLVKMNLKKLLLKPMRQINKVDKEGLEDFTSF